MLKDTRSEMMNEMKKLEENKNDHRIFERILKLQELEKSMSIRVKRNTIIDKIIDAECN